MPEKKPAKDPLVSDIETIMDDDELALQMVLDDLKDSADRRRPWENQWNGHYRAWKNKLKLPANYPLLSRTFMPLTHAYVETMVPYMMDAIFDERSFIMGMGREETDQEGAEAAAKLINYQLISKAKYDLTLTDTFRAEFIYGTAWQKPFWLSETQPDFRDKEGRPATLSFIERGKRRIMVYDDPMISYITPYALYPDFANHAPLHMRFAIHSYDLPASKLKGCERGPDGEVWLKNLSKIEETNPPAPESFRSEIAEAQGTKATGYPLADMLQGDSRRYNKMVHVDDWWSATWLVRIVNGTVVIYNGPNPWPYQRIPFVKFVPTRDPESLMGMGVAEVLTSLQAQINNTVNQRNDNINLALNNMWKIVRAAHVSTEQLVSRPGGYVEVNNAMDVTPLETKSDITANANVLIREFTGWAELATGITNLVRGDEPETGRFAASLGAMLQRSSGRRFGLPIKGNMQAVSEVVGMVHELNAEYVEGERVARILGTDGSISYPRIGEDKLRDTYADFIPVGKAASGNRDTLAMIIQKLDEQWYSRPELPKESKLELMRRQLALLDIPAISKIIPPAGAQDGSMTPEILQALMGIIASRTGGAGLPPGMAQPGLSPAPTPDQIQGPPGAVIGQPPSTTNPGGLRTIPIPGV